MDVPQHMPSQPRHPPVPQHLRPNAFTVAKEMEKAWETKASKIASTKQAPEASRFHAPRLQQSLGTATKLNEFGELVFDE